ncbi:hypothetical protein CgunFtcFv8_026323 [Champsocephalus gunnari]|uniref:Uncharacterized protein n=2 Tax=Champsocephalus gunnari TaxID=52237 RepID=A0AAN8CFF9_CHAGU|nr:hypothetical protein CgunFtcFv8_026323 [Champsocephalus gunnari]
MAGIEEMQTEEIEEDMLMDANRKQDTEENKEGNENKVAKKGESGEQVEVNPKTTVLDGKGITGETKSEVRAHPPPATSAAGYSKMDKGKEGRNAGGGKTACLLKGHFESTTKEGREEDE